MKKINYDLLIVKKAKLQRLSNSMKRLPLKVLEFRNADGNGK